MTKQQSKKSLVGWTQSKWLMEYIEHETVQDIIRLKHDMIFNTKADCCDMLNLPDGEYKPVKVRITIEELTTAKGGKG
jgi:hypothetical protein